MNKRTGNIEDVLPLSPLQEGMLFHSVYDNAGPDVYTAQLVFDLEGEVDRDRLHATAETLLRRHANLRAAFVQRKSGEWSQVVARSVTVPWRDEDVSGAGDVEAAAAKLVEADRWARFDLRRPPLVRFLLIRLAEGRFRFVMTNHHILWDGWSLPVLLGELLALYRQGGDDRGLPRVRPYRDYLRWLSARDRAESEGVWRQALQDFTEPTLLVSERSRTTVVPEQVFAGLDRETTAALNRCAREWGVTLNTIVQVGWAVVLSAMTGRTDVAFGNIVSGRPADLAGVETMVGLFINTVPSRIRMEAAESLRSLIGRVQEEQSRLVEHQYVGLADIQRWAGHGELFDTAVVFENYPVDSKSVTDNAAQQGFRVANAQAEDATHYPMSLIVAPREELALRLGYQPDVITEEEASSSLDRLVRVLRQVCTTPDRPVGTLDVLSVGELERITRDWNDSGVPVGPGSLVDWFERWVGETPEALALVCGDAEVSYAELNARANRLARVLVERGVGPDCFVGVVLPRSVELVVALLAVWKAGGAYVPVDPEY
ncbi:condensation domain-containing protein, partial [Streptomyces viridosporus]|uniref:condensation domain-containing protein n=1 Tax=Streptomyces viridosporus TaxID=67581 RepID=UPI003430C908